MKKLLSTLVLLVGCNMWIQAQQNPYLRFYSNNWQFINPAAMDRHMMQWTARDYSILNIQTRQQWLGFEGAPLTVFLSGERKPRISTNAWGGPKFGFTAYFDKTDAFSTMGLQGNYSYMLELENSENFIHFGLSFGLQNNSLGDITNITKTLVDKDDPAITDFQRRTFVDFGAGIMYRAPKRFYIGLSAPEMVRAYAWRHQENRGLYGNQFEQICLMAGGYIWLSDPGSRKFDTSRDVNLNETETRFILEPSFWVRLTPDIRYINWFGDHSPISCDINFRLYGFDRFWTGLGYGSNGNASIEFGTNIKGGKQNNKGYRVGVTSSFALSGRNNLGTSVELFGSYFLQYK